MSNGKCLLLCKICTPQDDNGEKRAVFSQDLDNTENMK